MSVVADQESLRCQNCQRQFSTVTGRKVHQTRFCKAGLSKNVVEKSKFKQLEASLSCDKCERKFKTVNGRKVHQSRYCGKPKAVATRVFSCKVQDVLGNEFENIEAFKYLGSYVSLKHGDLQEVNCKLAEGRQRFANFQNLWKSKQLSVHLKCNLYKALVLSAVLYSSETWTLSKLMERKLESFHCGCLRRILRVSYLEKATNEEIMSRSRLPQLSTMIMLKRIKWYGHIQRMEPGRLARSAFDWDPPDQYVHARRAPGGATENVDESNRRRLCTKQSIVHQIAGESSNRVKECLQQFRRTALHRITKQITLLVLFVFVANRAFISYLELKC